MGLAEEEVLIRDDSGLLLDVCETSIPKSQEWMKKMTKTMCLSLAFLVLGLCVAIPGPTLLDLEDQVKATTFQMMIVFASRSMGYLLGALLGGLLFDCFDRQLLLFCTLLVSSLATVAIPWSETMFVMATMFALQGITMGALYTGGNVFCIHLWGRKNAPFIQTLHFAFGIGAFVAPLLAKPFLSNVSIVQNTTNIIQGNIPVSPFLYHHQHLNMTRRSVDITYESYNIHESSLIDALTKNRTESYSFSKELWHSPDISFKLSESAQRNTNKQLKREHGNSDNPDGFWTWKRNRPSRDAVSGGQTETGTYSDGIQTSANIGNPGSGRIDNDESQAPDDVDNAKVIGPDHTGNESHGVGSSDTNIDPPEVKGNEIGQQTNHNKSSTKNIESIDGLHTKQTGADILYNITNVDQTTANITRVSNSSTDGTNNTGAKPDAAIIATTKPDIATVASIKPDNVTITTTKETDTEEIVHKPNAATDNNRNDGSADGKLIGEHLDIHKGEVLDTLADANEDDSGGTHENEKNDTQSVVNEHKLSNESSTVFNNTLIPDNSNITGVLNISLPVNITELHISSNTSSENKSQSTTTKSPPGKMINITETTENRVGEGTSPQNAKLSTLLTTVTKVTTTLRPTSPVATTTPSTSTKKPTTTTMVPTPTKKPTTTTLPPPASTRTEVTPPKSDAKVVTTEKLTTTTLTITEIITQSPTKLTNFKPSVPDQIKTTTTKPIPQVTTTPVAGNASAAVVSTTTTNGTDSDKTLTTTEVSMKPESTGDDLTNNAIHAVKNISRVKFAYLIIGLALFMIAIIFLVLYCKDRWRFIPDRYGNEFEQSVTCTKAVLIMLLGMFFFCIMGLEVTFGALVTTFAVEYNHWPKEQGVMVTAIFWGALAAGRFFSIFLARCCHPSTMLIIDLIFMIIGGLVLSIGIHFVDKLLWLGTLILGLGMSSVFPSGIVWAENYFHLSGKSTAFFVIGSAIGQMVVPIVTGYLYEHIGPIVLMHSTLAMSIATLVIFILMQCVAIKRGSTLRVQDRNGFLPLEEEQEEENLEMDDFVHFDKSQARSCYDKRGGGDAKYHTLISDLEDD